jgi:hypothetical protein
MTTADKDIQVLSDQLGLVNYPQDWGICNADANRIGEFIQVCRTGNLTPPQQYVMAELVLASMNESLVDGAANAELIGKFKTFLELGLHGLTPQIRYWASLTNREEFPLSGLLVSEKIPNTFSGSTK